MRADFEKGLIDKQQARALLGYSVSGDEAFAGQFHGTKTEAPESELSQSQVNEIKMLIARQWVESEHPRDENGRFTDGTSHPVQTIQVSHHASSQLPEAQPFNNSQTWILGDIAHSTTTSSKNGEKEIGIVNQAKGERKASIELAIREINRLHRTENIPRLPIQIEVLRHMHGGLDVRQSPAGLLPQKIVIDRSCPHIELTVAHEIGHLIDLMGIGQANKFASDRDPIMLEFKSVIADSNAIKTLKLYHQQGYGPSPSDASRNVRVEKDLIEYWLQDKELWARAYAQYIASKSEHPHFKDQLQKLQSRTDYTMHSQWSDEDFVPIARAINGIFEKKGWL
ncbi:MAG: hypothetical protein EOP06_23005 [Proteobacteria bacterium]|nr:MAG: hypothetical protein EOP06_23005 [Pseudomonadota bacterium]